MPTISSVLGASYTAGGSASTTSPSTSIAIPGYAQPGLPPGPATDTDAVATAKAAGANSASYSFADVAKNARTVLDAGASQLGHPIDATTNGKQLDEIFGNLDRRSLYAIASNQGGQFSKTEQDVASQKMGAQISSVLGNVSGGAANGVNGFGKLLDFLDNASSEEKQSGGWALEVANATTAYNDFASDAGVPQKTGDGTNPLVEMLIKAMKAGQASPDTDRSSGTGGSLSDLLNEPWAKGFEDQITQAYAATVPQGTLIDTKA